MILLAEVAAWVMRAALVSIYLSALSINVLVIPLGNGIIHNYVSLDILFILCSFFVNVIISGKPKFILNDDIKKNREKEYYFFLSLFHLLLFLLQGIKVKEIERNIVVLSDRIKVKLCPDHSYLRIDNVEPIKKIDFVKTIIVILIALAIIITSPFLFIKLNSYISKILEIIGISKKFSCNIILIFGIEILSFYFSPYSLSPWWYRALPAIRFSKKIKNFLYDFEIYECPIMPFLQNCPLGLAYKERIYINPLISENNTVLKYVVAHEEGHIRAKYNNIMYLLSPIIFPWLAFFVTVGIEYLHFMNKLRYTFWLIMLIAASSISLIFLIFIKIRQIYEERADEFAIRKIGIDSAIKALQELAYGDIMLPEKYKYRYRTQAIKLIERLKQK
ncbi:M48 family metalloprotease [Thermoanaerobacterium thermosaccharolyticum]|uniref:M48 family metalloprotease n=1 Tax=Thermoanaerobacterium thermosaccharolyticum TaxID=1517 RepID=UPI001053AAED|nr:M48 family metalloprotease [Thermoanaerobacterium thermosaccharolyticum]KAA5806682.1 M48 family metalloprotease [Thermoanaerobacterium thermosaccharolyticum]TCW42040.1 peptidase M48-like protein [Thermohydrogenium kirishiense]